MQLSLFRLDNEIFGIDITPVKEIIRMPELVKVPLAPPALLGLTNLRGKVIPVVSMRRLFGIPDELFNESTRAIVVDFGENIAVVVDQILSVISVSDDQIEVADAEQGLVSSEFLKGIVRDAGSYELIAVLELESVIEKNFKSEIQQHPKSSFSGGIKESDLETRDDIEFEEEKQIVCFSLEDEEYAFYIDAVQEIVQWPDRIVQIPNSPNYFLGIMRLRERFIPLISLSALFGYSHNGVKDSSRIVVINKGKRSLGIAVDKVNEVMRVKSSYFKEASDVLDQKEDMITSICQINERLISILSVDSILNLDIKEAEMKDLNQSEQLIEEKEEEENHMVTFKLGQEEYAVSINFVQEIVRMPDSITVVPNAPAGVEGIINLRGTVLPIIDLRQKIGMERLDKNERQRILVFLMNGTKMGFIVDSVTEVIRLPQRYIEPAPSISMGNDGFIESIANLTDQKRIIQILNPRKLVSDSEMESISEIEEEFKEETGD